MPDRAARSGAFTCIPRARRCALPSRKPHAMPATARRRWPGWCLRLGVAVRVVHLWAGAILTVAARAPRRRRVARCHRCRHRRAGRTPSPRPSLALAPPAVRRATRPTAVRRCAQHTFRGTWLQRYRQALRCAYWWNRWFRSVAGARDLHEQLRRQRQRGGEVVCRCRRCLAARVVAQQRRPRGATARGESAIPTGVPAAMPAADAAQSAEDSVAAGAAAAGHVGSASRRGDTGSTCLVA